MPLNLGAPVDNYPGSQTLAEDLVKAYRSIPKAREEAERNKYDNIIKQAQSQYQGPLMNAQIENLLASAWAHRNPQLAGHGSEIQKLLQERSQYAPDSAEYKIYTDILDKKGNEDTAKTRTLNQQAQIAGPIRQWLDETITNPYSGVGATIEHGKDLLVYNTTKDPKRKREVGQRLIDNAVSEMLIPENAIIALNTTGTPVTVAAQDSMENVLRKGYGSGSKLLSSNLPSELQKEAKIKHGQIFDQIQKMRTQGYNELGNNPIQDQSISENINPGEGERIQNNQTFLKELEQESRKERKEYNASDIQEYLKEHPEMTEIQVRHMLDELGWREVPE